jgi:hypothetical protein
VLGHGAVVTLWDVASGQKAPVLKRQGAHITALAFYPSGAAWREWVPMNGSSFGI